MGNVYITWRVIVEKAFKREKELGTLERRVARRLEMGALSTRRTVVVGLSLLIMRRTASLAPPTNVIPTTTTLKAGVLRTIHKAPLRNVKKYVNSPP